jgi:hypothetical protein
VPRRETFPTTRTLGAANGQIQAEFLEAAVWREVCDLLKNPEKLEREFKEGGDADASLQTWRL